MQFLYVVDPMCGWCYGFQPQLESFLAKYPAAKVEWIMGGLAPDTDQPMEPELRETIAGYWHQIEQRAQVTFNHDFWLLNTPYRSTYPACRAVIAAETLSENGAQKMVKAIQSAYYKQAKNPSSIEVLVNCASFIGLNKGEFEEVILAPETQQRLYDHLHLVQRLGVRGFPALFYIDENNRAQTLTLGYCQSEDLVERFDKLRKD